MINYQPFPTDVIAIVPPRDAQAGPRTRPDRLRARFARHEGLPFADVLTEARIHDALDEPGARCRDRVFSPVTTLRGFLPQAPSGDRSGRDAVARIIAHRAAAGPETCAPDTAGSCNARGRLPAGVLCTPAKRTARGLQAAAAAEWKWDGRDVVIADGSPVSMPDAPENRAAYPRPPTQQPGPGFPLARVAVLLSPATGAGHDLAIAPYEGTGTGETALLRAMYGALGPGDVALADALFDDYFLARELRRRGIDVVARAQDERAGGQVRRGRPDGEILLWRRPNEPRGMTGAQYRLYPEAPLMRQVTVDARDEGDRAERFRVVTTILGASIDGAQIGDLYERRWEAGVDIRSIKAAMRMDVLRCKAPEMVEKEIRAHLLAYNLLRTVMAVAAGANGLGPRRVSLEGAEQAVTAFAPKLEAARPKGRPALIGAPPEVIAYHRVGDRPGRWEPRARKRRPKPGAKPGQPRAEAKLPENRKRWS